MLCGLKKSSYRALIVFLLIALLFTFSRSEAATCVDLQNNMEFGSTDADTNGEVSLLQDFLRANYFLNIEQSTGLFLKLTHEAVKKYQKSVELPAQGYVWELTRAKIKEATCSSAAPIANSQQPASTPSISVFITQSRDTTAPGETFTVNWDSTNAISCGVEYSLNGGAWVSWATGTKGSQTSTPASPGTLGFRNTCVGSSDTKTATVTHIISGTASSPLSALVTISPVHADSKNKSWLFKDSEPVRFQVNPAIAGTVATLDYKISNPNTILRTGKVTVPGIIEIPALSQRGNAYYELLLTGSLGQGSARYSAGVVMDRQGVVSGDKNPFGINVSTEDVKNLMGVDTIELFLNLMGFRWTRPLRYNILNGSHNQLPSSSQISSYVQAWKNELQKQPIPSYHLGAIEVWNEPFTEIEHGSMTEQSFMTEFANMVWATKEGTAASGARLAVNWEAADYFRRFNAVSESVPDGKVTAAPDLYSIAAIHPYSLGQYNGATATCNSPEKDNELLWTLGQFRSAIDAAPDSAGHKKEIWSTEFGWTTVPPETVVKRNGWPCSELDQARFIVRSSLLQLGNGVTRIMPYNIRDIPWANPVEANFGLTRADFTPKPALIAYSVMAQTIDDLPYVGSIDYGPNITALLFGRDSRFILALWNSSDDNLLKQISIAALPPATYETDLFGGWKEISGSYVGNLSASPVYLTFNVPLNQVANAIGREISKPITVTGTAPTATLTINGKASDTIPVGGAYRYEWLSANADAFISTYSANCADGRTWNDAWAANTAQGFLADTITSDAAGCTYTVNYKATQSSTGKEVSKTITVTVPPVSATESSAPTAIANGQQCNASNECSSGYCYPGPESKSYCIAREANCAKPGTAGIAWGENYTYNSVLYRCITEQGLVASSFIDGQECSSYGQCQSGYCYPGPENKKYCVNRNLNCAQPGTVGVTFGSTYTYNGSQYRCNTDSSVTKLLSDGAQCSLYDQCQSNYCYPGPEDKKYCVNRNMQCAQPGSPGVLFGASYSYNGSQYLCNTDSSVTKVVNLQTPATRDAKRISDLRSVSAAMKAYFAKFGVYPPSPNFCYTGGEGGTHHLSFESMAAVLVKEGFLPSIPKAPTSNNPYMNFDYGPGSTAGSLLVTYLENINDTTVPPLDSCRPFVQNWCSTDTASKAYCLCNTSGTSAQNQKTSQLASAAAATTELTPAQYQVQNKFTYTFTLDLWRGQEGTEVRALQEALTAQGLYDSEITGGFFDRTLAAVLAFQTKYGINPIGYVGPATRAQLNALFSN